MFESSPIAKINKNFKLIFHDGLVAQRYKEFFYMKSTQKDDSSSILNDCQSIQNHCYR
ncbi:hypothetical protein SynA1825c_01665 [Synechococcus sp. A18-25c]|nr:hypothetical protein SynA1825c_01665 [Synechococcus sp. A18-25c]